MPCSSCGKSRAAALKASPTRNSYNPFKSRPSAVRNSTTKSFGSPKVRMSFGKSR